MIVIEKMAIYCQQGSGTLRQQLLMMQWLCQSMREYARVCQSMPEYANVCQNMPMYARVCQGMPETFYTRLYGVATANSDDLHSKPKMNTRIIELGN